MLIVLGAVTCAVAMWRGAHAFRRAPRQVTRDVGEKQSPEPPAGPEGRRVIAVVGIDRYPPNWPRLNNAVSDAKGALALFQRYGFELPRRRDGSEVTPLLDHDATGDAIRVLIAELEQLDHADNLIVFFAGHGHTVHHAISDDVVTTGYVIPVDGGSPSSGSSKWLRVDTLLSDIARLPPRHILVILDACNSGIALQSLSSFVKLRAAPPPGRRDRRSRRVITSARDDQSARDNGPVQGHSVFTGCLIEGFETGDIAPQRTQVTGTELGVYLERRVGEFTHGAQTPDCGAFEFDQRGDLVIEFAQLAPPVLAKVPEFAPDALGRRLVLPILLLAVGGIGLAMLSLGIYWSSSDRGAVVPLVTPTAPVDGGAVGDSSVPSNSPLPIDGSPRLHKGSGNHRSSGDGGAVSPPVDGGAAGDSSVPSNPSLPIDGSAPPRPGGRTVFCGPRPATIDFEHYPDGAPTCSNCPVSNEFACWGVTFSFRSLVPDIDGSAPRPRPNWCQLQGPTANPTNKPTHIVASGSLTAVPVGFPKPPDPLADYDVGFIEMTFSSKPTRVIFTGEVNDSIVLSRGSMAASGDGGEPNVMVASGTPYTPSGSTVRFRKDTITVSAAPNGSISWIRIYALKKGTGTVMIDDMQISNYGLAGP